MEVGKLTIPVGVNLGPVTTDLERLKRLLGQTENQAKPVTRELDKMTRVTQKLTSYVKSLGVAFAAAFGARVIVNTLVSLEQSMAAVAAVTGSTAEELTNIRDVVKELGGTTEFTASQVADGFKFMGLAGFSAAESIAAIPQVLDLATASSMDLARTADITSNIMSAFGIRAKDAAIVADALAVANANANTSIEQLGDGMKYAGPIANAFGISVGDTAAAIGTLSDAGIQGSMAGTGLRRILSGLANATPAATRSLNAMGLSLKELNPATVDLTEIIEKLAEAGLTAEQAFTIFGDRGAPAVLALVENNPKLRELTGLLKNAGGAASDMARIMRDNLWGDLKNVQAAIEAVIIAMGESGLTAVLRTGFQLMTETFRFLAEHMETIRNAMFGLTAIVGVQYVAAVGLATAANTAFAASFRALRIAIAGTGIGVLALILGDIIIKIWDAATAVDDVSDSVEGLGDAFNDVTAPARTLFDFLKDGADLIYAVFEHATSGIAALFVGAFATIYEAYANLVNLMRDGFDALGISELIGMTVGYRLDPKSVTNTYNELKNQSQEALQRAELLVRKMAGESVPELFDIGATFASLDSEQFDSEEALYDAWAKKIKEVKNETNELTAAQQKLQEAYQSITDGAREFIAEQELEMRTIGMTTVEANKLRYTFDLLNQATRAGIKLTPEYAAELSNLAAQMAEAEAATDRVREAYEFNKGVFKGFFSDLKSELQNGASIWEAFGNAAANALQKIADKALDMALNGIFDMIFGAFGGGGGFLGTGGPLSFFADGTSFAPGGWSVVGERGPELMKLPAGTQVRSNNRITAPSQPSFGGGAGGGSQRIALEVFVKDDGKIGAIARQEAGSVVEVAIHDYNTNVLPDRIEGISNHPRLRR